MKYDVLINNNSIYFIEGDHYKWGITLNADNCFITQIYNTFESTFKKSSKEQRKISILCKFLNSLNERRGIKI